MKLRLLTCLGLTLPLATAGCGYSFRQPPPEGVALAPPGATPGPACRVWDTDMYGRRYCRVRYVYGNGS